MEKWREWLIVFLSGIIPGLALWLVQRRITRNKDRIEFINEILDARLKISELTSKKIEEMEEEANELKGQIKDMIKRFAGNLDDCMKHAQNIQDLNIRLNHTLLEVTEELELYKEELQNLKNTIRNPET